jgi:hypothetical protein
MQSDEGVSLDEASGSDEKASSGMGGVSRACFFDGAALT